MVVGLFVGIARSEWEFTAVALGLAPLLYLAALGVQWWLEHHGGIEREERQIQEHRRWVARLRPWERAAFTLLGLAALAVAAWGRWHGW